MVQPPGESSCSAVALIHVTYANVNPLERFFRNMMLFRLPIIVYIITALHHLVKMNDMEINSRQRLTAGNTLFTIRNFSCFAVNLSNK